MPVNAADTWPTNGHLIADVASLYPLETVLDTTYGKGGFWTQCMPPQLITNDIDSKSEATHHYDFRWLPWDYKEVQSVVFDPPYKLNGTPALGEFDSRYGIDEPMRWQDRMSLIVEGAMDCARVARQLLLVKCQDQVVSGKIVWQTLEVIDAVEAQDFGLIDRFDMLGGGRPQPAGTRQVHAWNRPSTLLVFERGRN